MTVKKLVLLLFVCAGSAQAACHISFSAKVWKLSHWNTNPIDRGVLPGIAGKTTVVLEEGREFFVYEAREDGRDGARINGRMGALYFYLDPMNVREKEMLDILRTAAVASKTVRVFATETGPRCQEASLSIADSVLRTVKNIELTTSN